MILQKLSKFCLALICSGFCTFPARGQHFRDTVTLNDSDRDWQTIWTRGDYIEPTSFGFFRSGDNIWDAVTLRDQSGRTWPTTQYTLRESDWFESCFYRTFKVPQNTPTGKYTTWLNKKQVGALEVAKRKQSFGTLAALGKFVCTPDTIYRHYGTSIVGADIQLAPGVSIVGVTFYDSIIQGPFTNGLLKDCKLVRSQLGGMVDWSKPSEYADHGALYTDCTFERSTCTGCCSGAFVNCKWTGRVSGVGERNGHAFVNERSKRLCMFNCVFDATDRGPILRNNWGDNSDGLYVGLHVLNVNSTVNGNEAICGEGTDGSPTRWDRNMFFGLRVFNTTNHAQLWNVKATGNLFANAHFGPGATVSFSGIEKQQWNAVKYSVLSEPVKVNTNGPYATDTKIEGNRSE